MRWSFTVTIAFEVLTLPFTSVTVTKIVLLPKLVQLKVFGTIVIEAIPQLSNEPLSICDGITVT